MSEQYKVLSFRQAIARHKIIFTLLVIGTCLTLLGTIFAILNIPSDYYRRLEFSVLPMAVFLPYCLINIFVLRAIRKNKKVGWWFALSLIYFLCAYVLPMKKTRDWEEHSGCIYNMRIIYLACQEYADDHGGYYPSSLDLLYQGEKKYLMEKEIHCPGNHWQNPGQSDYLYFGAGAIKGKEKESEVLLQDKPGNHESKMYSSKVFFSGDIVSINQDFP